MNITLIIIIVSCVVSYIGFKNRELFNKLKFMPARVVHHKEYYRLVSYGFLHGSYMHLFVNMLVLYSFGRSVEYGYSQISHNGGLVYLILYFAALVVSNLYALKKHKNDYYYSAIGASGAVAAVLFSSVVFDPLGMVYFFGVIPIPGILFAVLYVFYSYREAEKNRDNIAHDAHILGAIFGFVFPFIIDHHMFAFFIKQIVQGLGG